MPSDPRTVVAEPDADVAYVAMSREALVGLLERPSGPLVVMGLEPCGPGYELILRRPNAFELQAALDLVGKLPIHC